VDLVRDVLDKQIVDRRSDRVGKVDGLVLRIAPGKPPRVIAIEVGPVVLARRLSPRLERWVRTAVERVLRIGNGVTRFDIGKVTNVATEVTLDVAADETGARQTEHWLREHVVCRIPGSGVKG
jgi:hypothetical protein